MSPQISFLYLELILLIIASLFYSRSADKALAGSQPTNQIKEIHDIHLNAILFSRFLSEQIDINILIVIWWCYNIVVMEAINFPIINKNLLEYSYKSLLLFQDNESKIGKENVLY